VRQSDIPSGADAIRGAQDGAAVKAAERRPRKRVALTTATRLARQWASEGDLWWASIGENVGSEINGKSGLFSRPVIVLRKLSHGFYFVVPTTTQQRVGSWFVTFRQKDRAMAACLHQTRAIDHRRLSSKIGSVDDEDFARVKEGFRRLIK
jgi:mRNA interferase MazF